jgi:hypothetical protein
VPPPDVAEIVTVYADVTAVVDTVSPTVVAPTVPITLANTAAITALPPLGSETSARR